ncbi:MAG: arginine--tRNA ligase [Bacteroidia bacterium]|nr:arginine--tRNA ligase [Bacteroidia bacterium]
MEIEKILTAKIADSFNELFNEKVLESSIKLEKTNKDHIGDYTFVVFPFLRISKQKPEETANAIGNYIKSNCEFISNFNFVKGFLNIELSDNFWLTFLKNNYNNSDFGKNQVGKGKTVMVEYSSPNTNKPLHLGHLRNILLGYSISEILKFSGYKVVSANLINDRGIHICKSMHAWATGNGETPESSQLKGDHLVGKYYVEFDKTYRKEIEELKKKGIEDDEAKKIAPSIVKAQQMLVKWEKNDPETIALWKKMNEWVYSGFEQTYKRLGVSFDKYYYESNTYLLGKDTITEGLQQGVFIKENDGSVWIDLTYEGLDRKLVLRADGTSVYITQDIGTAQLKYHDTKMDKSIYVVGNEQDYHFKVLKLILQKLKKPYADGIYHLSYGMVDLPSGKMKSREGTVVDADELMDEMHNTAAKLTGQLGKTDGFSNTELNNLYETIAMGALKYYLLKVEPVKRMLFNPEESIDFHGNTGPFIQYTFARISSVLKNLNSTYTVDVSAPLHQTEKELLRSLSLFTHKTKAAAQTYNPSLIANYMYEIAKNFNRLYHDLSILGEQVQALKENRLAICILSANVIKKGMQLLGIKVPERM